ncbi:hypothetical protein [Magnetococcus marinus]|uniref:hypothetical protein n=1 Tax=Magnetococcus marinus TaxID=1124597 RepID=UPI00003813CE|nr:hypothetical protein [Magnetococcus marinus]
MGSQQMMYTGSSVVIDNLESYEEALVRIHDLLEMPLSPHVDSVLDPLLKAVAGYEQYLYSAKRSRLRG